MTKEFFLFGVSHKTAPVEWREKFALAEERVPSFLRGLVDSGAVSEAVALSTCNRLEVYAAGEGEKSWSGVRRAVSEACGVEACDGFYVLHHEAALQHLFRVAAGLESLVVGESEILGQVKRGYEAARQAQSTGKLTNVVFQRALFVGKQVREHTGVSEGPTSVAGMAVAMATRIFGDLRDNRVLILGAGKMAEISARHFLSQKVGKLVVVNRTLEKARDMARRFGGTAAPFENLWEEVAQADVVLCSTGSPQPLLTRAAVERALSHRRGRPIFFIDIAVPRDVEPSVHALEDVYLYDIDDLTGLVNESLAGRRGKIDTVDNLVKKKTEEFVPWYQAWTRGEPSALRHSPEPPSRTAGLSHE